MANPNFKLQEKRQHQNALLENQPPVKSRPARKRGLTTGLLGLVLGTATIWLFFDAQLRTLIAQWCQPRIGFPNPAAALAGCPGYVASNVEETSSSLTADLKLAGEACNVYGRDLAELKLLVEYQTDKRLHIKIYDAKQQAYQIPESIIPSPQHQKTPSSQSEVTFHLTDSPFSFAVTRTGNGEVLFNTSREQLIFEDQYIRLRTELPSDPNLYGLGEHTDSFRLPTQDYHRTLWNADMAFNPPMANMYSSHPTYFDHRPGSGTHAVYLRNSGGMDVKIHRTEADGQYLEYNLLGGVLDLYLLAGPGPAEASRQYAETIGLADMPPYWALGIHQCKYGYWDVYMLAEVVANSSAAQIPLDVLWSDIDSMDGRKDFTLDEARFPMDRMRQLIDTLHGRGQKFITMLDSAVSREANYAPYTRGTAQDVFLKADDGSHYLGIQWPGVVVWPDWTAPNTQAWWTDEILRWFDPETGMDIDGLWNDMNEAANFCGNVGCDPEKDKGDNPPDPQFPPRPNTGRPIPGFPAEFQPDYNGSSRSIKIESITRVDSMHADNSIPELRRRDNVVAEMKGLPDRDLLYPKYKIQNRRGDISDGTLYTNISNYDGSSQYDTHNFYGGTMALTTRKALATRNPTRRPFVLTRSAFAGAGHQVAHWFGDNVSTWRDLRISILHMLAAAALQNMPVVGSDVCGFNGEAEERMCQRWTLAAAFQPFFRNHADLGSPHQEFYLWESVAATARKAIRARYRLLDLLYTGVRSQTASGEPVVRPIFYVYPDDSDAVAVETQWFLGPGAEVLISPVVEEGATRLDFYLPDDIFYDFWTLKKERGRGRVVAKENVGWDEIPVHIRGGRILPLREHGTANTTAELRKENFVIVVAPGLDGTAAGSLYLDDGDSVDPRDEVTEVAFSWDGTRFAASGKWGFDTELVVEEVLVLGQKKGSGLPGMIYDDEVGVVRVKGPWSLKGDFGFSF
ncbi:hypothetical protein MCOR04_009721 [Pyricularia oryzae]|uniref:alpha-glucosidase n=1 Tax=Pyricularia oryzae TaxID=318829 RepID=A0A4P7N0B6_PYROR|nr:hypothetical protein MCOR17_000559 [Pyricularia oryzae]KAI6495614.1 hypothetical protein MCOR13_007186 [Pyricularia oryzae]KAI6560316.1 hypothetical protein MCOR04_009721 [Pyricularia oryzae]QBZ54762.1 hypothetical protein PoMZ_10471 [Pyricularia oryzae]